MLTVAKQLISHVHHFIITKTSLRMSKPNVHRINNIVTGNMDHVKELFHWLIVNT